MSFLTVGLFIWLGFKLVLCFVANAWDCLKAASFALVSFFCAVACLVCFLGLFFVADFVGVRDGSFLGICLIGEIECVAGARECPGKSTGVDWAVGALEGPGISSIGAFALGAGGICPGSFASSSALRFRFSSKQNFSIFFLFLLYSPTVLHATKLMSRSLGSSGFVTRFVFCVVSTDSLDIAMSLFLITVFFLL